MRVIVTIVHEEMDVDYDMLQANAQVPVACNIVKETDFCASTADAGDETVYCIADVAGSRSN
jgi:hypothetical protein